MLERLCHAPTQHQKDAINIINIIVSSLSLIGSLLTIISYTWKIIREKRVQKAQQEQEQARNGIGRNFDRSGSVSGYRQSGGDYGLQPTSKPTSQLPLLIFFLSVSDFITSLFIITSQSFLLSDLATYTHSTMIGNWLFSRCIMFRAFIQYFFLSTFFWTACISYYLYQQLSSPESNKYLMWIFGIISYGIPFVITTSLTFSNSIQMDPTTGWCETDRVYELSLWFAPLFICVMICVFYYFKLRRLFRKKFEYRLNVNDRLRQIDGIISRRLTLYLLVFIITWLPDIIQHFVSFFTTCVLYPLIVIQNLLAPSQGFWNFWVYGYTNKIVTITPNEENKRLLS